MTAEELLKRIEETARETGMEFHCGTAACRVYFKNGRWHSYTGGCFAPGESFDSDSFEECLINAMDYACPANVVQYEE